MVTVSVEFDDAHALLSSVTIQAGNYLVFQGTGRMPATMVETYKQI